MKGRLLCALGSFTTALVVAAGVFGGLPSRWVPVDVTAGLVSAASVASGVMLLARVKNAERVARAVCAVVLGLGLLLVVVLAATASYLSGLYGPVGKGGAMVLVVVAALAIPYLIALPAAQLLFLTREGKSS